MTEEEIELLRQEEELYIQSWRESLTTKQIKSI